MRKDILENENQKASLETKLWVIPHKALGKLSAMLNKQGHARYTVIRETAPNTAPNTDTVLGHS